MNLIGARLRNLRKQQNMTLKEVAHGIISVPYLSKIERGKKPAAFETLVDLAERLGVEEELLVIKSEKEYSNLYKSFDEIVILLLNHEVKKAEELLHEVTSGMNLNYVPADIAFSQAILQATIYYRKWDELAIKEIEENILSALDNYDLTATNPHIQSYYYQYLGLKYFVKSDYQNSLNSYEKAFSISHNIKLKSLFCCKEIINAVCLVNYDLVLSLVETAQKTIQSLKEEEQGIQIQVIYYKGYCYFELGLVTQAASCIQEALALLERFPEWKREFEALIRLKYIEIASLQKEETLVLKEANELFNMVIKRDELRPNDYLMIGELMLIFAERSHFEEARKLQIMLEPFSEKFIELEYYIDFMKALDIFAHDSIDMYEKSMLQLLKKVQNSNDPVFIERVLKHASTHFASKNQYKKAYSILKSQYKF